MERKTSVVKFTAILFVVILLFASCNKKSNNSKSHTEGGVIISGYTPSNPTTKDDITLSVVRKNNNISFRWTKNGNAIDNNAATLKNDLYKRGDTLFCYIYSGQKLATKIGPIIIKNTPPKILDLSIIPSSPRKGTDLHIAVKSSDADGDDISYFIKWYSDGKLISSDSVLAGTLIKGGDRVYALVTPFDGFAKGISAKTQEITILNSAPVISSNPPTHLNGRKLVYQVNAEDPDGDPITFSLVDPPSGASIDSETGLLTYTIPSGVSGNINFIIKVSDTHGNYSMQKFSYTIK